MIVVLVVGLRSHSIDCKDEHVAHKEHHVWQREGPFDILFLRPQIVDLCGLWHHMDQGHAEEDAR